MRRFRLHTRTTLVGFLGLVVVFVPYAKSATAAPLSARAESGTFTETFSSTTYRDATTTADWNTALGLLQEQITTDGSVFNADKITTGPEQITNNSGDSTTQSAYSVAFDSQDRPNIVWSDDSSGNYEIYYSRWEPSKQKWEKANSDAGYDNVSNNEGISRYPVLRIKSNDRPVIAWEDHTDQIEGVVYREYSPSTGWATLKGTGGVEVPISTATGTFPNMVLDSLDRPHIAFLENPSKDPNNVYYKYWTGSAWAVHAGSANVSDNTTSSSAAPHIALNSKDEPTIAWQDRNPDRDIFLVVANTLANTWQDVAGNTYSDACIATTCRDTNVTQTSTLTDWPDLALDASGDPYLVYQDVPVTTAESFFTRWDPTSGPSGRWVSMDDTPGKDQLTNNGATTLLPRIALGPSDVPYITFSNAGGGTGVVYAIKWDGASWTSLDENDTGPSIELTKISDHDTVASTRQSIAVDSQGQPAFVWTDFASPDHEIYFGWWLNHYAKSGLAVSKSVATTTEQIRSATLTTDQTLNGGAITWELSIDGGSTWQTVVPGELIEFAAAQTTTSSTQALASGPSDLRWRATLLTATSKSAISPQVDALTIEYSTELLGRVDGDDPADLAIGVSKQYFPDGTAQNVIIAREDNLIDEFVGTPLASIAGAPLLLTNTASLNPSTLEEIRRVLVPGGTIYVLGQTEAINESVLDELRAQSFNQITRLGGARRHETANEIYLEIERLNPTVTSHAFLTEDSFLVDSFAISPVAGDLSDNSVNPILITNRSQQTLNPSTADFIKTAEELTTITLIGGTAALTTPAQQELAAIRPDLALSRIAGSDRYDTNIEINDLYFPAPTGIVVANGQGPNIPGSLSLTGFQANGLFSALFAGVYAAARGEPLILVETDRLPEVTAQYIAEHADTISSAYVVGNELDVSNAVQSEIQSLY